MGQARMGRSVLWCRYSLGGSSPMVAIFRMPYTYDLSRDPLQTDLQLIGPDTPSIMLYQGKRFLHCNGHTEGPSCPFSLYRYLL